MMGKLAQRLLHALAWLAVGTFPIASCDASSFPPGNAQVNPKPSSASKEPEMNSPSDGRPTVSASRGRAPLVPPVVHKGVRYEQLRSASGEGLPPGGYVVATDVESGKRLWVSRVYESTVNPNIEADVQNTFFKSMRLDAKDAVLVIEDEKGRTYRVGVADGKLH